MKTDKKIENNRCTSHEIIHNVEPDVDKIILGNEDTFMLENGDTFMLENRNNLLYTMDEEDKRRLNQLIHDILFLEGLTHVLRGYGVGIADKLGLNYRDLEYHLQPDGTEYEYYKDHISYNDAESISVNFLNIESTVAKVIATQIPDIIERLKILASISLIKLYKNIGLERIAGFHFEKSFVGHCKMKVKNYKSLKLYELFAWVVDNLNDIICDLECQIFKCIRMKNFLSEMPTLEASVDDNVADCANEKLVAFVSSTFKTIDKK
jgi:hypothetical protein